jgi:hypothetical protein
MFAPVLEAVLRTSSDLQQFVEIDGFAVHVVRVPSISYPALEHLGACGLFKAVDEVIADELGVTAAALLAAAKQVA